MQITFVRHGQTTWNAAGRWQGQADTPLTAEGHQQAEAVARSLSVSHAGGGWKLLASDLARARKTAEAIGRALGLAVELEPRFRERDVGDWSGGTHPEIEARDPEGYRRFRAGDPDFAFGGGESTRDLRARAFEGLAECKAAGAQSLLVVTHLGLIRSLVPGVDVPNAGCLETDWRTLYDAARLDPLPDELDRAL